jgi:hypothetical protein
LNMARKAGKAKSVMRRMARDLAAAIGDRAFGFQISKINCTVTVTKWSP